MRLPRTCQGPGPPGRPSRILGRRAAHGYGSAPSDIRLVQAASGGARGVGSGWSHRRRWVAGSWTAARPLLASGNEPRGLVSAFTGGASEELRACLVHEPALRGVAEAEVSGISRWATWPALESSPTGSTVN
ncbi:DUF6183 family protein [Streptomyces sp. NPDC019937]|uniref:DUF6183 family protein n=1 Tax=Streptomyces sp. NPDC019937 TaxID=3154787 RepID=UPI00340DA105